MDGENGPRPSQQKFFLLEVIQYNFLEEVGFYIEQLQVRGQTTSPTHETQSSAKISHVAFERTAFLESNSYSATYQLTNLSEPYL